MTQYVRSVLARELYVEESTLSLSSRLFLMFAMALATSRVRLAKPVSLLSRARVRSRTAVLPMVSAASSMALSLLPRAARFHFVVAAPI